MPEEQPRHRRLKVNGTELSTWTWPGGDPGFLLVHGLASNARLWDELAEQLSEAGHAVTSLDLRGHGLSARPDDGYDFATIVDDLSEVLAALAHPPVIAAGQSWGGNLVLELADRHPELVSALVLIDGGFIDLSESFPDWQAVATTLAPPPLPPVSWEEAAAAAASRFPGFSPQAVAAQLANLEMGDEGTIRRRLPLSAHMAILRHLYDYRPLDRARRLDQPALIVAAANGEIPDKAARVDKFQAALCRGRVHWLPGHHDLHAEQPGAVATLIRESLREGFLR